MRAGQNIPDLYEFLERKGCTPEARRARCAPRRRSAWSRAHEHDTGSTSVSEQATLEDTRIDELCVNTIRTVSMDALQQANSGHPGTPMITLSIADCLWRRFLRFGRR
jgi:hypothetical protein